MASFKDKIDLKWVFIFVLGIALILSLVFRKSNKIDTHEDEKALLEQKNKKLQHNFDSGVASELSKYLDAKDKNNNK